jgi:nitrogen fixation-related uncharacterized protein
VITAILYVALQIVVFVIGFIIAFITFVSSIRTFVLPRSAPDFYSRGVFVCVRYFFAMRARRLDTYEARDRAMELYAPASLIILLVVWLLGIHLGYMCMFWSIDGNQFYDIFKMSGSSLLTLGFEAIDNVPTMILIFSEAILGLILIAILIGYLPAIYSSFSRREASVTMLETRAGSPPSPVEMIIRYSRLRRLELLGEIWQSWEIWFVDIEESHTSLGALNFFRSPQAHRSWITAAGVVLDGAALTLAAVDTPRDSQADLCIRAGYLALRYISDFFGIEYNSEPDPTDSISISREEFNQALDELAAADVPLKPDRERAWRDYAGWRVNYDTVLLSLAELLMAPYAPWVSDRTLPHPSRMVMRWRRHKKSTRTREWLPPEGY